MLKKLFTIQRAATYCGVSTDSNKAFAKGGTFENVSVVPVNKLIMQPLERVHYDLADSSHPNLFMPILFIIVILALIFLLFGFPLLISKRSSE